MNSLEYGKFLIQNLTETYEISKNSLSRLMEIDLENEQQISDNLIALKALLNPFKFKTLLTRKGNHLTYQPRLKAESSLYKIIGSKMYDTGVVFAKILQSNELGIRPSGGRAGSFALVPKDVARNYFEELPTRYANPNKNFKVRVKNQDVVYDFIYTYHNDKHVYHKENGRDEYRIYSGYFSNLDPDDIIIFLPSSQSTEDHVIYHIRTTANNYGLIKDLVTQFKVGRSSSALIPILALIGNGILFDEMWDLETSDLDFHSETSEEQLQQETSDLSSLSSEALADLLKENLQNEGVERTISLVKKIKRNRRFRIAVIDAYEKKCAVSGTSISFKELTNVHAAHIKGKEYGGSDHPSNGIALSMDLHWAFDNGFFTIQHDFKIKVHERAMETKITQLQDIHGKEIHLPKNHLFWPNIEMLSFHQNNIFGKFIH
ncbi:HNH endonuclease [Paenibacillus oryzisoli]|uniref:HNH endonuclease n=1 Tax=Paenibacillus oryzisoli TaxID=1850517 RepID=UPI003D2BC1F4